MGEKQSEKKSVSEPQAEPPSPSRRSASGLRAEHRGQASPAEPGSPGQPQQASGHRGPSGQEHGDYETLPQDDPDEEAPWRPRWTDEEWREWYRRDGGEDSDEEFSSGEDLPWDELEQDAPEVLPPEILGWLLLRRANLSSSARLSVQASVQNSLNYEDIERALRDQEEELLQGDAQRQQFRGKRTFWVEDGGEWGLMTVGEEYRRVAGRTTSRCSLGWQSTPSRSLPSDQSCNLFHGGARERRDLLVVGIRWMARLRAG